MKKLLLATAVCALGLGTAQAAPTVYGKLHATISSKDVFKQKKTSTGTNSKGDTDSVTAVDSFDSRFGVKGEEKLTDNLAAIYGIEWAVNTDGDGTISGGTTDLTQRNRFVGLKFDRVGSVKVGRLDTHFKTSQGKVDVFNDMYTDMKAILVGENRINNVISFESDPKALEGVGLNLMLIQAENNKLSANSQDVEKNFGSALSGSIVYDNKEMGLFASVAGDQNVPNTFSATGVAAESRAFRGTAVLDMGTMANVTGLSLGALIQTAKPVNVISANAAQTAVNTANTTLTTANTTLTNAKTAATNAQAAYTANQTVANYDALTKANAAVTSANTTVTNANTALTTAKNTLSPIAAANNLDKENAFLVSATFAIPDTLWALKAEYGQSTTSFNSGDDIEQSVIGALAEYKFNSKTRAYGYISRLTSDQKVGGIENADRTFGGVGMEYNF